MWISAVRVQRFSMDRQKAAGRRQAIKAGGTRRQPGDPWSTNVRIYVQHSTFIGRSTRFTLFMIVLVLAHSNHLNCRRKSEMPRYTQTVLRSLIGERGRVDEDQTLMTGASSPLSQNRFCIKHNKLIIF